MPLNVSAMYFGIALGSFVGGQTLKLSPPAELGIVAAVFSLGALGVLAASARHTRRNSSLCGMYPLKANAAFCRRLIEPVTLPPLGRVRREEGPPPPRTLGGA